MMRFDLFKSARAVLAAALALVCAGTGCAPKYTDLKSFLLAHENDVSATTHRLQPPDIIAIISPTCPEVDGEAQRIGAEGKISLKLLGEVYVASLTPAEAGAKLEDLLSRYYESPRVTVQLASDQSEYLYVFGEVMGRGPYPFSGRDTLLDLLARARPTFLAWGANVKVIRPSPVTEERHEITVDVDKMMQTGDLKNNVLLEAGDIVYVPPTPLGWCGLRIRELLFPLSPALTAYGVPLNFREDTDDYKYNDRHSGSSNSDTGQRLILRR